MSKMIFSQKKAGPTRSRLETEITLSLLTKLVIGQIVGFAILVLLDEFANMVEKSSRNSLPLAISATVIGLISLWIGKKTKPRPATYFYLICTTVAIAVTWVISNSAEPPMYFLWPILVAVTLIDLRTGIFIGVFSVLLFWGSATLQQFNGLTPLTSFAPPMFNNQPSLLQITAPLASLLYLLVFLARLANQNMSQLLQRAKDSAQELQELNQTLEQRVEERTGELKQATETIQSEHEILLQSEKMASLGRLTSGIAHEINTPLAAARTAMVEVDRLAKEYQDSIGDPTVTPDDYQEIAQEMHQSLQLADSAMEHVAGFMRGIKAQTRGLAVSERVRFNAVTSIRESLLLVTYALRKGNCTIAFETPSESIELLGSPGQLAQIVTNLVTNAIDASAGQHGGSIVFQLTPHAKGIDLIVRDQGSGIPPEILPRIFDLLFTTKQAGSGTGLGLTIVHDIVTDGFGGTIEVASQQGQGAVFTIHFPYPEEREK